VHLHEIRLAARRREEQRALYAEAFGLVARRDDGALVVEIGDARLVLAAGEPTPQHFAIRIPSASYADALGWLGERAELLTGEDGDPAFAFSDWNADSAYFADPDGNIVELIAHHDLPEPYTPPFGPSALLGICEAGMPVADVGAFLDELERRTGARRWSGDRETFAAAGTKAGSLIVVRSGRVWYPTDSAAATRPPLAVETDAGTLPW
jgi:catechol 2,3-dioxygenase-like lactoylglutathione lyase family enzyme